MTYGRLLKHKYYGKKFFRQVGDEFVFVDTPVLVEVLV